MKYKSIELNEYHKAQICPICDNEEVSGSGIYCKICGVNLIQACTNLSCKHSNPHFSSLSEPEIRGNARCCETCGEPTTFYNNNLLKSWQEEQAEIHSPENYAIDVAYFKVAEDEDVPF